MTVGIVLIAWVLIGLGVSLVLGRRGHDSISWLLLGLLLGPLSLLLAVDVVRHDEGLHLEKIGTSAPTAGSGGISVLVGYDDSPDAHAVTGTVIDLFGDRLDRLTLVAVLPFDNDPEGDQVARDALRAEARQHPGAPLDLETARGRPATALLEAAEEGGFDVLAVGIDGAAHSRLFGDTTGRLSHQRRVPVLICGRK